MVTLLSYLIIQTLISILSTAIYSAAGVIIVAKWLPKLSALAAIVVSFCIGMALFGSQAYVFGWLGIRLGGFVYLGCLLVIAWQARNRILDAVATMLQGLGAIPRIIKILLLIGILTQIIQMGGNGLPSIEGARYYRTNAFDGIFHLGLIESLKTQFPPEEPSTSGLLVQNYHYWSDMIIAEQSRLFGISAQFLFFQWMPLLISSLSALATYACVQALCHKCTQQLQIFAGAIALVLLFFGSDAGWIFPLYLHNNFTFEYPAIDNGPTQFLNMPHTFGKLFFYAVCLLYLHWRRDEKVSGMAWGLLLTAISFGLKIYFGIVLTVGWMAIFALDLLTSIRTSKLHVSTLRSLRYHIIFGLVFVLLTAAIYLPVNAGAGGLSWYPLEWPKLLVNRDNFDWSTLNYRIAIAQYTHNVPKSVLYNGVLVGVGLVAIFGARALGMLVTRATAKLFRADGFLFLMLPAMVCTFLGMATLQDSGGFNVFNFFAVSMPAVGLSLALTLAHILSKRKIVGIVCVLFVLGLSLPRSVFETTSMIDRYRRGSDSVLITPDLTAAFAALRRLPITTGSVLSSPENPLESKSTYIRAFSGKPTLLAGKYLLETHGQPFAKLETDIRTMYQATSLYEFTDQLSARNVRYIWIDTQSSLSPIELSLVQSEHKAVFANPRILIYDRETL